MEPVTKPVCLKCKTYPVRDCAGHVDGLCWPCRYDHLAAVLRRCAIELEYVQIIPLESGDHEAHELCATPVGRECIEDAEKLLGPMRDWPENAVEEPPPVEPHPFDPSGLYEYLGEPRSKDPCSKCDKPEGHPYHLSTPEPRREEP